MTEMGIYGINNIIYKFITDIEYSCRKKKIKREEVLEIMDEMIPWDE